MGEHRTTRGEPPPPTARERKGWFWRSFLLTTLVLGALGAAGAYLELDRFAPASGYVTTDDYAEVRAPSACTVTKILAQSGDRVARGNLLVQLEDAAERGELAEAEAAVRVGEAELALRTAELARRRRQLDARREAARLALEHARACLALTQARGADATGRELADSRYAVQAADAACRALEADAGLDEQELEVARQRLDACRRRVARTQAAAEARAIRAPIDGRLMRHTFYVGEVVRPDTLLFEIFGGTNLILKLRVPERYATRVTAGQSVRANFRSDRAFWKPGAVGRVLAVREVIQTDGPQAYRVVTCSLDPVDRPPPPPGTTADARIHIGRSSFWASLFGL